MNAGAGIASEIDRKLREDFRRKMAEFGISVEAQDPALSILFRTFAGQIEDLYIETEQIRTALLDEIIGGLGLLPRAARPAQTVLRFQTEASAQVIEAGTEVMAGASETERVVFAADHSLMVSPARIAFAAYYDGRAVKALENPPASEGLRARGVSREPVVASLGPLPALYIAVENLGPDHLSGHSIYFDVIPYALGLRRALQSGPWRLAHSGGGFPGATILRPARANAGVHALRWLLKPKAEPGTVSEPGNESTMSATLPDGFYTGTTFVFPVIPPELRTVCRAPRGAEQVMAKLFPSATPAALNQPRTWIRIDLPEGCGDPEQALLGIHLHAMTASNVECLNQTVYFERDGVSIPVSREGGSAFSLVQPISVTGESGREYVPGVSPGSAHAIGKYELRGGRMRLYAGPFSQDRADRFATLRLWVTNGTTANAVQAGGIRSFLANAIKDVRVANLNIAAGGSNGESFGHAQDRFSFALLSRDRLVTQADLDAAVRAFDRRIRFVSMETELERTTAGLLRIHRVTAAVNRADFADFSEETRILREELGAFLQDRSLFSAPIRLTIEEGASR